VSELHALLPAAVADPARPSGGNAYDRRACSELRARGWVVKEHLVGGAWPDPDDGTRAELAAALEEVPDGGVVLVDGLLALRPVLAPAAERLRLVLLVHLPSGDEWFPGVRAVIATSAWSARQLSAGGPVLVAVPGSDPAPVASGTPAGRELLCVGALAPHKGQDVLVDALAAVADLDWRCRLVGPLDRDREFVADVRHRIAEHRLAGRVELTGSLTGAALADAYARADLLVLPSLIETYGMVVTEALARGVPVVASDVGGVPEALGHADDDGRRPGSLVPPDDAAALGAALRRWLGEPSMRAAWRTAARARRPGLPRWEATAKAIAALLGEVAA